MGLHLALPVAAQQLLHELQSKTPQVTGEVKMHQEDFCIYSCHSPFISCCVSCKTPVNGFDTPAAPLEPLRYTSYAPGPSAVYHAAVCRECKLILMQSHRESFLRCLRRHVTSVGRQVHQILLLIRGNQAPVALLEPHEHLGLGQWAAQATQAAQLLRRVRPYPQVHVRVHFHTAVWPPCSTLASRQDHLQRTDSVSYRTAWA